MIESGNRWFFEPPSSELEQSHEKASKALILCLCHGNVLRSQWAEFLLELLGIDAISAALGDVSKQKFNDEVPIHILTMLRKVFGFLGPLRGKKIKQVDQVMFAQATEILVFADPKYLSDYAFIDATDPRIRVLQTIDPFGNIGQYEAVLLQIATMVLDFLRTNFKQELPEKLRSKLKLKSLDSLVTVMSDEIENWKQLHSDLVSSPVSEYFISQGTNNMSIIYRVEAWIKWHEMNTFSSEITKYYYPSIAQCNEIVREVEQSKFDVPKQIFEKLLRSLENRRAGILRELEQQSVIENNQNLQTELELLLNLISIYKQYIRYFDEANES